MGDTGDGKISDQANHIWSMLNDMSQNDPSAYRKFIDKHIKEGKDYMKPPQPHMCVSTARIDDDHKIPLYLNICEWARVPAPKNDKEPIPITGSAIYNLPDEGDDQAIAIAFNPVVLEECGRDAPMTEEQGLLIGLCLDYVERQKNVRVSRNYSVLPHKVTHKGSYTSIKKGLMLQTKQADDEFENELEELEKTFGPGLKNSVLNIAAEENSIKSEREMGLGEKVTEARKPEIKILPSEQKPNTGKTGLIQEMDTSTSVNSSGLVEPEFEMKVKEDDGNGRRMILRVNLPSISSVAECELDISQDDIKLTVPGKCQLIHRFHEKIVDENAKAKYNKKSGILSITLPICSLNS